MEEKFMKILASVSDYSECNFRVGGAVQGYVHRGMQ